MPSKATGASMSVLNDFCSSSDDFSASTSQIQQLIKRISPSQFHCFEKKKITKKCKSLQFCKQKSASNANFFNAMNDISDDTIENSQAI